MEITHEEYLELKNTIKLLEEKLNAAPRQKNEISKMVSELPISNIFKTVDNFPDFEYSYSCSSEAWKDFLNLARRIHAPTRKFYMDETYSGSGKPYIRSVGDRLPPKKIADMTDAQIDISVQMLNELIPIYNKYFKKTHEFVLYSDREDGQYRRIYVEKELQCQE